jgi:N-acetylneuraminic acid mutarotase
VDPNLQNPIGITFSGQSAELQTNQQMTVTATTTETVESYQWYLKGSALAGATNPSVTVGNLAEGHYRLDLFVTKGDVISSETLYFDVYITIPSHWANKADLIFPAYQHGSAAVNGKIYVIGGSGANSRKVNQEYNLNTNTWSLKANLPVGEYLNGVVALNDNIYSMGGYQNSIVGNLVLAYYPATNTWYPKANLKIARAGAAIAKANGKLYVMGGMNASGTCLNYVEEYDPAANTWTIKTSMPYYLAYIGAATVNRKIYIFGGYNPNYANCIEIVEYDPSTDKWRALAVRMTVALYGYAIATVNNKIYVIGGYTTGVGARNTVYEFNPTTQEWKTKQSLPVAWENLLGDVFKRNI